MSGETYDLTPMEIRVLRAWYRLGTAEAVAAELHRSKHTVEAHMRKIHTKTKLHTAAQLFGWAGKNGLLDEEPPA